MIVVDTEILLLRAHAPRHASVGFVLDVRQHYSRVDMQVAFFLEHFLSAVLLCPLFISLPFPAPANSLDLQPASLARVAKCRSRRQAWQGAAGSAACRCHSPAPHRTLIAMMWAFGSIDTESLVLR